MIPDLTASTRTAINLRRAALVAACSAVASFLVLVPLGYPLAAVFCCAGLGLGLLNTTLVQRSSARFAVMANPNKKRFAVAVLGRLALITVLALSIALLVQPDGLGVFAGLAIFQLLMIFLASAPLLRELRQAGTGSEPPTGEPPTGEPQTSEPPTGEPPTGDQLGAQSQSAQSQSGAQSESGAQV